MKEKEKGRGKNKRIRRVLHFSAFQVTTGASHEAKQHQINKLLQDIGDADASIFYMVPEEKFSDFVTVPAQPAHGKIKMYHVSIPSPMEHVRIA
jgi:hypothetical protein